MSRILVLGFLYAVAAGVTGVHAQPDTINPDSALTVILNDMEGTRLPLSDAVEAALGNATSYRKAEAVYLAAGGKARRESGAFDPELFFTLNYLDQKQPTASFFSGAPVLSTIQTTSAGGLRMYLPTGTELVASLNAVRLATNSTLSSLNPQYTAFGSLSMRQPLLGGFLATGRRDLGKAEEELESARARYDQERIATSSEVERRYWDLYAAERDYAVQKLIRDQAEIFLRDTESRAKAGLIGPNQVANAKTFLAEQTILLLDREEQLDKNSDQLASYLGARPVSGKPRYLTVDTPPSDVPLESVETLVEKSIEGNLEVKAARADVAAARTDAKAAGWEALPTLNFVGSLGGNGLGGVGQVVSFGTVNLPAPEGGTFSDAVRQVGKRDFPTWSVGVEMTVPIGFRNGLGEKDRLDAEVVLAEQRLLERIRLLEEQVRASYRELAHGKRRISAAREGVDAAQEQVRIGLIEFHNGRSTAFELVRLGADLAAAQRRYSEALVRTAKAATTLKQLTSGDFPTTPSN